jgi:hypothetical protein
MITTLRLRAPAQVPSSQSSLHPPLMCGTTEEPEVCLLGLFGLEFAAAGRGYRTGGAIVLTGGGTVPAA